MYGREFIELDRRFVRIADSPEDQERLQELELMTYMSGGSSELGWDDLLQKPRVVVLGEPGSGKSDEFWHQAERLAKSGNAAFFIDLRELVSHHLVDVLDRKNLLSSFHNWRTSRRAAWFFLDAVDESRIENHKDFVIALENLGRDLDASARNRVHILISSRISAWQGISDLHAFASLLDANERPLNARLQESPNPPSRLQGDADQTVVTRRQTDQGNEKAKEPPVVVGLTPLTLNQIERLGTHYGADGGVFRRDIEAQFLHPLARRPLDVKNLVRYWIDKGRFGSYMEMLAHSVAHSLQEPEATAMRDRLSPERVFQGAESLAAMVLLCRQRDIALPGTAADGLQPRETLPESWLNDEVRSLLDRAIFDAPLFNRVRFHHRETEEYLTARWLQRLVNKNLPLHRLKQQLFDEGPEGSLTLRPSMGAVSAWFASFATEEAKQVLGWIRLAEPELFLRAGDPSQLSVEYRKSILDTLVAEYASWKVTRLDVDRAALTRLADAQLAEYLAKKVTDKSISDDLRGNFFYMAEYGRFGGLEQQAIQVILDNDESSDLRSEACDYLSGLGDVASLEKVSRSLASVEPASDAFVQTLLTSFFPKYIARDTAVGLVLRMPRKKHSIGLYGLVEHCRTRCSVEETIQYMDMLNQVVSHGPPWYRDEDEIYQVGACFVGLGNVLFQLLPYTLSEEMLEESQVAVVSQSVLVINYLLKYGEIHTLQHTNVKDLLAKFECIRRECVSLLLTAYLDSAAKNVRGGHTMWIYTIVDSLLQESDADWIVSEASECEPDGASYLLEIAHELWRRGGHPIHIRRMAKRVVRSKELDPKYGFAWPGWFGRRWFRSLARFRQTVADRFWWASQRRQVEKKVVWWRNQFALLRLLPKIRRGEHERALWVMTMEMEKEDASQLVRTGWDNLRHSRGAWIEKAVRGGVKAYWRRFSPTLKYERADNDQTIDGRVIIGLTGIHAAWRANELDFVAMCDDEVEKLTRYALNELNGFPGWFVDLASARTTEVVALVMSAIKHEWNISSHMDNVHEVLADLVYDSSGVYRLFIEPVLDQLVLADPVHPKVLSQAIRLGFRKPEVSRDTLRGLAVRRADKYPFESSQHMEWMNVLMQFDDSVALEVLERALGGTLDRTEYMLRLAGKLSIDGRFDEAELTNPSYRNAGTLRKLIPTLFEYLPPESDPYHPPGEAHRVTSRDEAARFRDGLIPSLAEMDEDGVEVKLEGLINDPVLEPRRDWIRHLALRRRRRQADMEPWSEHEVRMFEERHEKAPGNPRELWSLICDRLQDIKDWVETGEDSPRGELHADSLEKDIRIWVARKLKERSRGLFTVPEENELADGKKQDIRIDAPGFTGPIIIEAKQKEGWSYVELRERLENQLVGDYLKAHNARFGIFLITFTAHKNKGSGGLDPKKKKLLTLSELVQSLQKLADEIVGHNADVEGVRVFSIDFVNV